MGGDKIQEVVDRIDELALRLKENSKLIVESKNLYYNFVGAIRAVIKEHGVVLKALEFKAGPALLVINGDDVEIKLSEGHLKRSDSVTVKHVDSAVIDGADRTPKYVNWYFELFRSLQALIENADELIGEIEAKIEEVKRENSELKRVLEAIKEAIMPVVLAYKIKPV